MHAEPGRMLPGLPAQRDAFVQRFEGKGAVIRRDGWCVALSGYHSPARPGQVFTLDRTEAISIWHDRTGLLIGGGNDKHSRETMTFQPDEGGMVQYYPPENGDAKAGRDWGRIELDYGSARGKLEARIRSARRIDLAAEWWSNFGIDRSRMNLQIPIGPGGRLRIDGKDVRLRRRETIKRWPIEDCIEIEGVLRLTPTGRGASAEFLWPHRPWDCYNLETHRASPAQSVGILRLPLPGNPGVRVELIG
jgi:hypothetical protein